jgi:hypothetical protein
MDTQEDPVVPEGEGDGGAPCPTSPAAVVLRGTRLAFLKSLSDDEQYRTLVRKLKGSLKFDDLPKLPAWSAWSYSQRFLPASFYTEGGFEIAITDIGSVASDTDAISPTLVLAFGLVLREIRWARESDTPARAEGTPDWVNSAFLSKESESRVVDIIERFW